MLIGGGNIKDLFGNLVNLGVSNGLFGIHMDRIQMNGFTIDRIQVEFIHVCLLVYIFCCEMCELLYENEMTSMSVNSHRTFNSYIHCH